jgi:hypothetical protein
VLTRGEEQGDDTEESVGLGDSSRGLELSGILVLAELGVEVGELKT